MKEKSITIPALISLIMRAAGLSVMLLLTFLQNRVTSLLGVPEELKDIFIFPISIVTEALGLAVVSVFVYLMFTYKGDRRRLIGIIIFAIMISLTATSFTTQYIATRYYAIVKGSRYLAKYSTVNSVISNIVTIMTLGASPLFYIALGRYGVAPRDGVRGS